MAKPYNSKRRSKASRQGWITRRENMATKEMPDYGISDNTPTQPESHEIELGGELPVSRNALYANMAEYEDIVFNDDPESYTRLQRCLPIIESIRKLSIRTANLDWTVVGKGRPAEIVKAAIQQAKNWTDMIEWLTWGLVEGVRFMQIKRHSPIDGTDPDLLWVPDFWLGGRTKDKAGGSIQWDGGKRLVLKQEHGVETRQSKQLPIKQFIIHRPGAGSNPEGDLGGAYALNKVAVCWDDILAAMCEQANLAKTPMMVIRGNFDDLRPEDVASRMNSLADRLNKLKNQGGTGVFDEREMIELLDKTGHGFRDMADAGKYLEGLVDQYFLGNTLTSKTDETGRTGDTSVHKGEEDEMAFANAMQLAASLNRFLIPWVMEKNDIELQDGETMPYLWPVPPEEEETSDQDVAVEGDETIDPDKEPAPTADIEEVEPDAIETDK